MNIPPIIGLVIALSLGMAIGGGGCQLYRDKQQVEADAEQIKDDNELAADITVDTDQAKATNTVKTATDELRTTSTPAPKLCAPVVTDKSNPVQPEPRELNADEINNICNNHVAPTDIVRAIRSEAAKARRRFNDL